MLIVGEKTFKLLENQNKNRDEYTDTYLIW